MKTLVIDDSQVIDAAEVVEVIECRMTVPLDPGSGADVPTEIMYMPAGTHAINASRMGKPIAATVQIDRTSLAPLQSALQQVGHKPWFDFDHSRGAASGWPTEFLWRDTPEPGIYCKVQWSKPGADAISGKAYRSFSPTFTVDDPAAKPAKVTGARANMGGLVNDPAFTQIMPLWAKQSEGAQPHDKIMTEQELAAQSARLKELEKENAELKAKAASSETTTQIEAKDAEIATLNAKVTSFEEAQKADRKEKAKVAVDAAIARGAIPPKDTELQAKWSGLIAKDPTYAELLAKQPAAAAAQRTTVTKPETAVTGTDVRMTREDISNVCNGYIQAKTALERGWIYHNEINARLDKGEIIPFRNFQDRLELSAANSLGTLVGNIISQRALALVYSKRPLLKLLVTDFSDQGAAYGQAVLTRTIGLPTVQAFPGGAATDRADTDYTVTLNQAKQVLFTLLALDYNATNRDLVREQAEPLAVALGNYMVDFVAALITTAFATGVTVAAAAVDYGTVIGLTKTFNVAGVPDMARRAWINSDVASSLRNDEIVMENFDRNATSGYAHWQNVEGFEDIWEFPALPTTSNLSGFFAHQNALLLASRTILNPEALIGAGYPGRLQTITDPISGLSVVSNDFIDQASLTLNSRLIALFGAARGNLNVGRLMVTA